MPKPFPKEFRDDVIRVAESRDPEVTLAQIAKDFGVHVGTLDKWMRQARIEAGEQPGQTSSESAELRELRRIVGYCIDSRMKASLAVRAVRNAARMRENVNGCIVHSDRGSQFRSRKLRRELAAHNLVGSMGRVASCGDCESVEYLLAA